MAAKNGGLCDGDLDFLKLDIKPRLTVRESGNKVTLQLNRKSARSQRDDAQREHRLECWLSSTEGVKWKQTLLTPQDLANFLSKKARYEKQALVDVNEGKKDPITHAKTLVKYRPRRNEVVSIYVDEWGEKRWFEVPRTSAGYRAFDCEVTMKRKLSKILCTQHGELFDLLIELPEALARPVGKWQDRDKSDTPRPTCDVVAQDRDESDTWEVVHVGINGSDAVAYAATARGKGTGGVLAGLHCFITNNGEQCCDMNRTLTAIVPRVLKSYGVWSQ